MSDNKKFLAALKTKGSILKKIGNEKAPEGGGFTSSEDIIKAFGLKKNGGKVVTTARGTKARSGVDKKGHPYVSINFVCTGDPGKGQTPSKYINLTDAEGNDKESGYRDLAFTLQRLGYDTRNLTGAKIDELLERFNKDRPEVSITIERWGDGDGLNVYVNRVLEEGDVEDEEEEDEEEDQEAEEEEDDDLDEEEVKPKRGKAKAKPAEEDEEEAEDEESDEDDEDSEEDDDDSSDFDPDDPTTWVGEKATVKTSSMRKASKVTLLSYNARTKTFKAKNSKGEQLSVKVAEVEELD